MARLDYQSFERNRALREYHCLAYLHGQLTPDSKPEFVSEHPELAAKIFYHFDDRVLGQYLARYLEHPCGQLRNMAINVVALLRRRALESNQTETILGMRSVPTREEERDDSEED